jgi:hypothetical protein
MHRRTLLSAAAAAMGLPALGVLADSSEFKAIEYSEIPQDSGIANEMNKQGDRDQIFVPPMFRYRLALETRGKIEALDEDNRTALSRWGTFVARSDFVSLFQHKVEVAAGPKTFWIPWQNVLIEPFQEELRNGGQLTVNALLIGARLREPLLLAIGFRSA